MVDIIKNINSTNFDKNINSQALNNNSDSRTQIDINIGQDSKIKIICQELGITEKEYCNILLAYPNFPEMSLKDRSQIVQKFISPAPTESAQDPDIMPEEFEEPQTIFDEAIAFDYKEYEALPVKEKVSLYSEELAKNNFLFAQKDNPKSLDDWKNLDAAEKQKYIAEARKSVVNDNSKGKYDEASIGQYFSKKMLELQTANSLEKSLDEFKNYENDYKGKCEEYIHDYIFNLPDEHRTDAQNQYMKNSALLSAALVDYCKEKGDDTYSTDGSTIYELPISEIIKKLEDLGGEKDLLDLKVDYLSKKRENGLLTPEEENILKEATNLKNTLNIVKQRIDNGNAENTGLFEDFLNTDLGQDYKNAVTKEDKIFVLANYLDSMCKEKKLSEADAIKFKSQFFQDFYLATNDFEAVNDVYGQNLENASDSEKNTLADVNNNSDVSLALAAQNIEQFGDDSAQVLAAGLDDKLKENGNSNEFYVQVAMTSLNNMTEEQRVRTSQIHAGSASEKVQMLNSELALDKNKTKDPSNQETILTDIYNGSNEYVVVETGKQIDKVDKSIQLDMFDLYSGKKSVAEAMNEDGTLTRLDKNVQTNAFKILRNRFEQDDFTKDEAIQNLYTLADQIQNCDKDNQLDMHNDIMGSKYSEVQRHAAGNIGNYDPSVQSDALNSVYATGNDSAVEAAVESIANSPSADVVEKVMPVTVADAAVKTFENNPEIFDALEVTASGKTIKEKIASGARLTLHEYSSLTPAEKREYFMNFFKALSPNEKIKLIKSISSTSVRNNIYKMIARTNNDLFDRLIQDPSVAEVIYNMSNVPGSIKIKIEDVANRKQCI